MECEERLWRGNGPSLSLFPGSGMNCGEKNRSFEGWVHYEQSLKMKIKMVFNDLAVSALISCLLK